MHQVRRDRSAPARRAVHSDEVPQVWRTDDAPEIGTNTEGQARRLPIDKEVAEMPGLDGTGPMGMGPMTGGARGWCNPYSPLARGYWGWGYPGGYSMPYRMPYGGFGYGCGMAWGRGGIGGRGMAFRRGWGMGRGRGCGPGWGW